jgi:TetR/AcrR family transcriptional regulator, cholesterol catabolism regulator
MSILSYEMSVLSLSEDAGSKRERKKRDKEARIRQAALRLFRDQGFAATTTRQVADHAGIAAGTLFLYVRSKEELVDFVFTGEIAAVVDEALRTLPRHGDVAARMMHLFGALLDFYAADPGLARVLLAQALLPAPGARSMPMTLQFLERLAALLDEARAAGRLVAGALPVELALHAFTLYVGAVLTVVNGYGTADEAKRTLRRALHVHLLGLRAPAKPNPKPRKRRIR